MGAYRGFTWGVMAWSGVHLPIDPLRRPVSAGRAGGGPTIRDYGRSVSEGPIFVFSVSEPMPIYVREVRGQMVATGMERPLDWPRDTLLRGGAEIPLERLPGEIGPRIEPPADWHAEHHPEHLEAEPVVVVRRGEPEQIEYVDVWSGATVSVE